MIVENIKYVIGNLIFCFEDILRIIIMICSVFKENNKVLIYYN